MRERRRAGQARREAEATARHAEERERRAFADAVGPVRPLRERGHRTPDPPQATPEPRQRQLDEQAALREAWSDTVDVESLLLTDDGLGFRRAGVPPDVLAKLRRGHWAIQGGLDLHGLRRDEAREALASFIGGARRKGWRCLRVVHGKGLGSPGRAPVLKAKVQRWLAQSDAVIAFAQASAPQGGAGALIVLLAGAPR
ncbi:MAG: Smr/MutS family protein [Rubrivivax sp.]|nr:Smr/MutS family protein [Rubrivivax sp.]